MDARFLLENGAECAIFTNLCQSLRIYEGTKIYTKHNHRNVIMCNNEFDYDFDIPEVGKLYRFLMFETRNRITDQVDNLIFELTDLIYILQLQDDVLGKKYWEIRKEINKHNYDFFMKSLTAHKSGQIIISKKSFLNKMNFFAYQLKGLRSACNDYYSKKGLKMKSEHLAISLKGCYPKVKF